MCANELLILPQAPPTEQLPPEIRDAIHRFQFDVDDGRFFMLTLDHGHLSLEEGGGKSDSVISCSMETFHHLLSGELNLLPAFMRGDVRLSGNLEAASHLYRFLRLSRGSRGDHP